MDRLIQKYRDVHPLTATLNFSKQKYNSWLKVRWHLIRQRHNDMSQPVFPCMAGEHFYKGNSYDWKTK